MAQNRYDRTGGRDDVSRVGYWTPETPEFLEKRDERRAASRSSATSYTQAKATIRRISVANQAASEQWQQENGRKAPIIDFSQLDRSRYGYARDDYFAGDEPAGGRSMRIGAEITWDNHASGKRTRSARASLEVAREPRGSTRKRQARSASASRLTPSRLPDRPARLPFEPYAGDAGWEDYWEDDAFVEEPQPDTSLRGRIRKARSNARSRKAERAFNRRYAEAPAEMDEGPRAAVYKGKMGRQHQRASRMQQDRPGFQMPAFLAGIAQALSLDKLVIRPWFVRTALVFVCAVLAVNVVYAPAQAYYLQSRANDQMLAEYQAVIERNAELEQHVAALQTDEGIEELAHESLGWIREGEHSVSVLTDGSSEPGTATIGDTEAITEGSVPAPETWYSPVLDAFFGYEG